MEDSKTELLARLLASENKSLTRLREIVDESIKEEQLISESVQNQAREERSVGEKIADKVAEFGGSWRFIILFMSLLVAWILVNAWVLATRPFDPYPFILLNLILSCIAALQAPVIMMSQNRKEMKDRRRAENDYLINLKAEIEVRNLHKKVDLLIEEQLKRLFEIQELQMKLLIDLKEKLESSKNG